MSRRVPRLDSGAESLLAEDAAEHKADHALRARRMLDRMRRMTSGARRREAVIARVAARLGFDPATISALHARDYETCKKQITAQRRAVHREVRRRMTEQRALLRHVLENRERFEWRAGNPVTNVCVWQTSVAPVATVESDAGGGGSVNLNPAAQGMNPTAGANRITLGAACSGMSLLTLRTHHRFEATAPHGGILSVAAFFAPVGSFALTAAGACFGSPGFSMMDLRARVKVRLRSAAGDVIRTPNPAFSLILHHQTEAGCEADAQAGAFNLDADAFEARRPAVANVNDGDRIIVTAQYNLLVETVTLDGESGAEADLDLSGNGHGLNVPVVLMTIED